MASPSSSTATSPKPPVTETEVALYRLAVDMADRVSARRGTANAFFLSLNAAIITVVGVFQPGRDVESASRGDVLNTAFVAAAGIALSVAWWLMLRSYRDLNAAKFRVIIEIEERLPIAVFRDEWAYLKKDPVKNWRDRYAELGDVERIVPMVFGGIYAAMMIALWIGW